MYFRLTVSFLILLSSVTTNAQLVNVEKSRKEAKPGLQGSIDLNLSLAKNTKQIFEGGTTAHIQYTRNRHLILALNSISLLRAEGSNLINDGFQHIRYNYSIGNGFATFETFTQHQYNSIRLLQRRFLLGIGPRLRIYENENFGLYLAPLVMYEQEKLNDENQTQTNKIKGDLYISTTYSLDKQISFSHTTYYQPDLNKINQFRLASDTGLEVKFNTSFSFIVTYSLAYDTHPPDDIPNLFYTLKNGIKYNF